MNKAKEVVTLHLEDTVATRRYPFTADTLAKIKELRAHEEAELLRETGHEHMVPAPYILACAIYHYHAEIFPTKEQE